MKKILIVIAMLFAATLFAQNSTDWSTKYYGDGNASSDSLQIAVGDSVSGEYSINNVGVVISVDSNWTASNLGFMVYNYLEEVWEPLTEGGTVIEYTVTVGEATRIAPADMAGLKTVKFYKVTSESAVAQSGSATSLQISSIKVN